VSFSFSNNVYLLGDGPARASISLPSKSLEITERGLIVAPPLHVEAATIVGESFLDPQELRAALLFWDRLDLPYERHLPFGVNPDMEFLKQEGILEHSTVRLAGPWNDEGIARAAFLGTLDARERAQPGQWSLARGERSLSFADERQVPEGGASFELHQVIPVPDRQVPFDDILSFKQKRSGELKALRHHIEEVVLAIAAAPDQDLAKATEISKLDTALADHIRASKELKFPLRLSSIEARFNTLTVGAGFTVAVTAMNAGLPLAAAALSGASATVLASLQATVGLRGRDDPSPFEYVSKYHENLW
jgi:hypothetical protein